RPRRHLRADGKRVRLFHAVAVVTRRDVVFVTRSGADTGNKPLPDARRIARLQRASSLPPTIEFADHAHALRGRRPHGELGAGDGVEGEGMGTELLVKGIVSALVEEVKMVGSEKGSGCLRHWRMGGRSGRFFLLLRHGESFCLTTTGWQGKRGS